MYSLYSLNGRRRGDWEFGGVAGVDVGEGAELEVGAGAEAEVEVEEGAQSGQRDGLEDSGWTDVRRYDRGEHGAHTGVPQHGNLCTSIRSIN
jgi:hypothetical protein